MKRPAIWSRLKYYLIGLYQRLGKHHVFLNGGGLAFSLFICIMPFLLILFSLLGSLLANESIREQVSALIDTIIPYSEYAVRIKMIIFHRIEEIKDYRQVAGYVGLIGLLLASSGFFSSLRTILNNIFKTEGGPHPLIAKLRDVGMVFIGLFLFMLATLLFPFIGHILKFIENFLNVSIVQITFLHESILFISSPIIVFILFYLFYKMIPTQKVPSKMVALSALWAAVFWKAAEMLFGFFLTHFASLKRIYGTYVFLIVIVFWIYYTSIIFIIGAEIGQLYRERRSVSEAG